jgi:cell division protein FtsW
MLFSASSVVGAFLESPDRYFYLRQQGLMAALGLGVMVILSRLDYHKWRPWILLLAVVSLVLLLVVKVPGVGRGVNGATRWIDLGLLSLQPSEVAKLATIGLGAHLLSLGRARDRGSFVLLWPFAGIVAMWCGLILAQPDLGTVILLAIITMGLLWVAGMRALHWFGLMGAGLPLVLFLIMVSGYRKERLFAFLDPWADPSGSGFQLIQSLLALGSGGWLGVGPGRSVQKFSYLPEAHTDMIFAIVGEELGLAGAGLVIVLFALFLLAAWRLARRCADPFGKYLVTGCLLLVCGQAVVNLGGVLGALPLTGVPLPFISFGRTNLLVVLASVGVILSVARFGPDYGSGEDATVPQSRSAGHHRRQPGANHYPAAGRRSPLREDPAALSWEPANVAYLDSRRRNRRPRRPGPRPR